MPKVRRNEKTARHSARFYALRAARCADGSRPIPTNIPETDFFYKLRAVNDRPYRVPVIFTLPLGRGRGMPRPYRVVNFSAEP